MQKQLTSQESVMYIYSCLKLPHVNKRYDSVNFDLSSQKTFGKSSEISAPWSLSVFWSDF